jgi:AcrR family transcriptional regulator
MVYNQGMARPREFDEDEALGAAMLEFWAKGYEGTTLSDLLQATGLNKSSLYKAFGSKEELFRRAADRYDRDFLQFRRDALERETPREIIEELLLGMARLHAGANTPPGCMQTNAAIVCSTEAQPLRQELAEEREAFRVLLKRRLAAASHAGPLPQGMSADEAASLVATLIQGMSVQANAGATRRELTRIVKAALRSFGY